MLILLVSKDKFLAKRLRAIGDVILCDSVEKGIGMSDSGEFDYIIAGPPFTDSDLSGFNSEKLRILKDAEDLQLFQAEVAVPAEEKIDKPAEGSTDPEIKEDEKAEESPKSTINAQGKVLLASINRDLIFKLNTLDLLVATTGYSAKKALIEKPKIVIWDLPGEPMKATVPVYTWGKDISNIEDIAFVLRTGTLRIKQPERQTAELIPVKIEVKPANKMIEKKRQIEHQIQLPAIPNFVKPTIKPVMPFAGFWDRFKIKSAGVIVDGQYIKGTWKSVNEILNDYPNADGVVIPKSFGINAAKEYQRDPRTKTTPLIVIKGNKEWLIAGADQCVRRVTPKIVQNTTALAKRLRKLWELAEIDALTGLYSRKFFNTWLSEQEKLNKPFSLVMIDIDKFKNINDTYGHPGGDAVLAALGMFLKEEIRENDFVARYGGEEFVIGLLGLSANQGYVLIDRLRDKWSTRVINTTDNQTIKSTFSAGLAEWRQGCNIVEQADQLLYKAKENGRNQVKADITTKVLTMGKIPVSELKKHNIDITYDPLEASAVVCDVASIKYVPVTAVVYVLGTGSVSDWLIKRNRPDAVLCLTIEDIITKLTDKDTVNVNNNEGSIQKLTVLPGARSNSGGQTITQHGALYVVCPSRPAQAGEMAVRLCNSIDNTALICAAPESTAALTLGISTERLIISDWRIPGASAPVLWTGIMVWPVDPYKHIGMSSVDGVHQLIDQIKPHFPLVVVDCGGSLDICSRVAKNEGVLVLHREGDSSDIATTHWMKTYGGSNVMVMVPSEVPDIVMAENGFVISHGAVGCSRSKI